MQVAPFSALFRTRVPHLPPPSSPSLPRTGLRRCSRARSRTMASSTGHNGMTALFLAKQQRRCGGSALQRTALPTRRCCRFAVAPRAAADGEVLTRRLLLGGSSTLLLAGPSTLLLGDAATAASSQRATLKVGPLEVSPVGMGTWRAHAADPSPPPERTARRRRGCDRRRLPPSTFAAPTCGKRRAWGNELLWGYDSSGAGDPELQRAFDTAVAAGVRLMDTADSYGTGALDGRSEMLLGRFCAANPSSSRVTIATKFAVRDHLRSAILPRWAHAAPRRMRSQRWQARDVARRATQQGLRLIPS